ncbi:MAG TPA: FtsX-like permease family protein, partial [Gemmatimonadaceae bacterium]|nr:FtsX-like permease family protein [Gemmatimonadaceae bacterium]
PGFDGSDVAVGRLNVGLIPRDSARAGEIYDALIRQLQRTPGVRSAAIATTAPLDRGSDSEGFRLDGYIPPPGPDVSLELADVTPGYFETFQIPLVRGRLFTEQDSPTALRAAIINQTMARRYWNGQDPIGKRIFFGSDTVTVVGVVRDSKYHDLSEPPQPFVYRVLGQHLRQSGLFAQNIAVRGSGNPSLVIGLIRRTIAAVAPEVPIYNLSTFEESTGHAVFAQRLGAIALGLFGLLAIVITAVGIYGVVGYNVAQRTREIGIRIALGARTQSVVALVLIDNLSTIALGLGIGVALSAVLTRSISGFLFKISPLDAATFITSCLVLLVVGSGAALIPALRATRVDPAVALRTD